MKQKQRRVWSFLLAVAIWVTFSIPAAAASKDTLDAAVTDTAAYVYLTVKHPQVGSIGGEWAVLGLARSDYPVPDTYVQDYYAAVESDVKACDGKLHDKKYTEYSRVIVALSAIGKDARNVAGYDLTKALGDYDRTIWQGLNGPIWALIALDSRDYPMPQNAEAETQATRQMYVDRILECQLKDGGWSLFGGSVFASDSDGVSDPDITGMALQALAKYQDQPAVKKASQEALAEMSKRQRDDGGFDGWDDASNVESSVQMLVALGELNIPFDDSRFVKNGNSIIDGLLAFYKQGGGFVHKLKGTGSDQMATEQGFYGLVAAKRALEGKNSLYRMGDAGVAAVSVSAEQQSGTVALPGKHADVKGSVIIHPGKTFDDLTGDNTHPHQAAIEGLAARGIIDGKGGGKFDPEANMSRAEFAAIVDKALGLVPAATSAFSDVPKDKWYAPYVGTAYTYDIINGKGETTFDPDGIITRQEASIMVERAARLCGIATEMDGGHVADVLAQFTDYVSADQWAQSSLAFCYNQNILDQAQLEIRPKEAIKRGEIAQMLYQLLDRANLL